MRSHRLDASSMPILVFLAAFVALSFSIQHQAAGGPIVQGGESTYVIVLDAEASPSEDQAAAELQEYIERCTGAKLPLLKGEKPDGPAIVLGRGVLAKELGVNPSPEALGDQGYVIRTVGANLVIAGTPMAGTLYGVYDLLEDHLGVRWYAPGVTKTPHLETLPLPQVDALVKPPFLWRITSYTWPGRDAQFLAHVRQNNGGADGTNSLGIQYAFDGWCHTYFNFISPGEFFDEHPEYFSEIGGQRRGFETQLCLTNPDVLDIVTERMLKRMADRPGCRQHNFSQMDYYRQCECAACSAMNEKYQSKGGTQFWFVNELAKRTSKQYPDKQIGTLAYMYTEGAPKGMTMHPNAAVWLCHMFPSCDSHPITTCPDNADYKRRADAWSEICSHLYIWHYIVDFAHYYNPFPNFRALAANIRFYRDIGVEGVFLQAMGHGGGGGEFSMLRPYFGMQLLRNPDADPEVLIQDFLGGYYGPAAKPIYDYVSMLHDKVENDDIHIHLYTNPAMGYLSDAVMSRAMTLFDEAEAAVADDAELLERVKVARMPLTYARVFPRNGFEIENGRLAFPGESAKLPEVVQFLERMKAHGFSTIREQSGDPKQLLMFSTFLNTPSPVTTISNGHLEVDIVPFFGGRAIRITDLASGKCITNNNISSHLYFPFAGGEETRLNGTFWPIGFFDQYSVAKTSKNAAVLEAEIGGYTIRRTMTLLPGRPALRIEFKATNTSGAPKETSGRCHLELNLGDLRATRVRFQNRDGETVERDMAPIIAGLRLGEHYREQKAPKGEWVFTGSKGLEVTQRFDDADVDFAWLYAYPERIGGLDLEVWSKSVTLEPGQALTFAHELEISPL